MKRLIGGFVVVASLSAAWMTGCTRELAVPSGPLAPTATQTSTSTRVGSATPTLTASRTSTSTGTVPPGSTATSTPTETETATETSTLEMTATPQTGQLPVDLGSAAGFVVLAYTTITNSGPSTLCGDLGLFPGSAVVGAPVLACGGVSHVTDTAAATAQGDLTIAYNDAAGRTTPALVAGNLGGQTLYPGLYKSTGSLMVSSGDLTLDAQGDVNGVFIFQIASTLTTSPGRQVILAGGAKATNVFWQVGSYCALDTTTSFVGTIMAHDQITLNTGAVLEGRALSQIDEVTMLTNAITMPAP